MKLALSDTPKTGFLATRPNYSATVLEMQVKGAHHWMMMEVKNNLLIHNDKKSFADSDKIMDRDKH